jgi:flagellar biosynthetic protein FliR
MELVNLINDASVITFLLLFVRFSAIMVLFPFFSHTTIPISIKTALALYLSFLFFTITPPVAINHDITSLAVALLSEIALGIISGFILQLAFYALTSAGEQIAFVMGFTMASVMDPQTGTQTQIISNTLTLLAVLMLLILDAHHTMLLFIAGSMDAIPLGGFILAPDIKHYIFEGVKYMFIIGFTMAFPIIALSLLSDVIFGMLMKTMPQFNLLVVGFPIKIALAFVVLVVTLAVILQIFTLEFEKALTFLSTI